jgi:GDP-4-dehydro-6-deoxy-D-mannose reductase
LHRYLITGFSGFVARHFVDYLEKTGEVCLVKGLDVQAPDFRFDQYKHVKIGFDQVDLLVKEPVEDIVRVFQPTVILHLASFSSVALSWKEPVQSFRNNTNVFLHLIDSVRKLGMSVRILSVGSSEEYGNVQDEELPLTEEHCLMPVSPYAVARVSQEYLSRIYADGYGMDIVLTRSFNHIGPLQRDIFVVSSLARQLVALKRSGKKRGAIVTGDVSIVRDFTDVRDVVRAYHLLMHQGRRGEVYNVCSGRGLSLKEIIEIMAGQLQLDVDITVDDRLIRPADNRKMIGSNEKIKHELGWENTIPLEQSLQDMIRYWEAN